MLFEDERKVLLLRFERVKDFSIEELKGANLLRVLTYSASEDMIRELAPSVEEMEVIFGAYRPIQGVVDLVTLQHMILEDLQGEIKILGQEGLLEPLLEKMRAGKLRFLLSRKVSHAKLFLVERGRERFALFGSANLSRQAFSPLGKGGQVEILARLEDEEGYAYLSDLYESLKRESDLVPIEILTRPIEPHEIPLLQKAQRGAVVLEVPKEVPKVYQIEHIMKRSRLYKPLETEVKPKGGQVRITPEHVKLLKRSAAAEEERWNRPIFHIEEQGIRLGDLTLPYLNLEDEGVAEDAQTMVDFLEGYLSGDFLHEEEAQSQVEAYWRLWCWFWTAPLMSRLLRRAHSKDYPPHAYPLYALVYGKANTGKTTYLRFLSRSVTGSDVRIISGVELSQALLLDIHRSGSGLPVIIDDASVDDVPRKVEKVLKSLYEVPPEDDVGPVVLSLNGSQNYAPPDEVKKRAFLVRTMASLDTTNPEVIRRTHTRAQRLLSSIENRFYRAFVPLLLEKLEDEMDWLLAASEVLAQSLNQLLSRAPSWVKPVSYDELFQEFLNLVKSKVSEILKIHRQVQVKGNQVLIKLGLDARRYAKELPGWLVDGVQGDFLILSRKGLAKLGFYPKNSRWSRLFSWLFSSEKMSTLTISPKGDSS